MGVTPRINMDRVARYVSHLAPEAAAASADDDIVIVSAIRTAICRARKGGFRDTQPDALLSAVLKETVARAPNAPIGHGVVGNVLQGGAGALTSRMAQLCAGISEDVPCHAINRQCSSGLQAGATVAGQIKMGVYDFGIAAGVESMSKGNMMDAAPKEMNPEIFECEAAQDCMIPMGITSENVANKFGVTREQQDQLAADSHNKAEAAQANGWFKEEIIPVHTIQIDKEVEVTITEDEHPQGHEGRGTCQAQACIRRGWLHDCRKLISNFGCSRSCALDHSLCCCGRRSPNHCQIRQLCMCRMPTKPHGYWTSSCHPSCTQEGWHVNW